LTTILERAGDGTKRETSVDWANKSSKKNNKVRGEGKEREG